jgi:hypothetical protein
METLALLDIPNMLASGPRAAPALAEEAGLDGPFLFRLLRAAVAGGLLNGGWVGLIRLV